MLEPQDSSVLWIVVVGFILAFVLAFGIGANDVANTFGTSVGAKVLTLRQACIIASIFELAGAILVGSRVSDTVRKGIIDIQSFNGSEPEAMVGAFSALSGTSVWLIIATFFRLPVSGTHSIVGATIGYALVAHGSKGIKWKAFGMIAASWVISPLMAGIVSSALFVFIRWAILNKSDSLKYGIRALPVFYGATITINFFSVFYDTAGVIGIEKLPIYAVFGISVAAGFLVYLLVLFLVGPWIRKRIERKYNDTADGTEMVEASEDKATMVENNKEEKPAAVENNAGNGEAVRDNDDLREDNIIILSVPSTPVAEKKIASDENPFDVITKKRSGTIEQQEKEIMKELARSQVSDEPRVAELFKYLQIMTASFGAFAHGGNDVSNAIGPLISLWIIYQTGHIASKASTPIWILVYGGVAIVIGLCVWGRRVIKTVGENLSPITPSSGFTIEIGSALTVLVASNLGIPVSTTHCKVGSVVFVGRVRSKEVVDWSLFGNIVLSWVITMPITGGIAAALFAGLRELV